MTVKYIRDEVRKKQASWRLVRDAVAGSEAVKAGGYLSPINGHDDSKENRERNKARLNGAVYVNATGRTLSAMTGIAFGKWPEVQVPAALDYVLGDADGSGIGIINQSQSVVSGVLQTGRSGLLVDFPTTDGPAASRAAAERGEFRATINHYAAESIINWRTVKRGARTLLGMVVLRETVEEWDDFERKEVVQYRVLLLGRLSSEDDSATERYVVQVWKENGSVLHIAEEYAPLRGDRQPWDLIPFAFVGATNNDSMPDQPPLYDLADLNIAHFRNSADFEESLFFAGQAQYWVSGVDVEWAKEMQKAGVYVGSRAILPLPEGGQAGLLQAQPVSALSEEMGNKIELMGQIGARLIAPGQAARTATEATSDDKTSNSVLSIVCDNVSDAYRKALNWAAQFMRASGKTDFSISTEFSGVQFDAQQMAQALAAVQSGKMPESDFWAYCRSIGLIAADKDDDEIRDELETQGGGVELEDDSAPVTEAEAA